MAEKQLGIAPSNALDIATKSYVDSKSTSISSTGISDSTATGRALITAATAATARSIIGASDLVIGTTSTTAKAGNYQPTSTNISDSTTIGRTLITAASSSDARTAIGAGTSSLVIGTTSTTAKAGNYQPVSTDISDSTTIGRTLITAVSAEAARIAIGITSTGTGTGTSTGTTVNEDVYNWKSDNTRRIQRSIAKSIAGQSASHLVIGDSYSQSYTGTQNYTAVWPYLLRQFLNAGGVRLGGTGWVPAGNGSLTLSKDPRYTLTGTWTDDGNLSSFVTGSSLRFVSDLPGTNVSIAYPSNSGVFTVSIDGGAPVSVTPSGASPVAMQFYSVSNLANSTHTVTINRSSGSTIIYAIMVSGSGLQIHNLSLSRATAISWAADSDRAWMANRLNINPDVVHIALGLNDLQNARTTTQCVNDIQTIINAWPNSDVILYASPAPNPANTGITSQVSNSTWSDYVAKLYALAQTLNRPLVDMYRRGGGSYASAVTNGLMADGFSLSVVGHADWGLLLSNLVLGR
jgi:lysophospholipase L1-like esterase